MAAFIRRVGVGLISLSTVVATSSWAEPPTATPAPQTSTTDEEDDEDSPQDVLVSKARRLRKEQRYAEALAELHAAYAIRQAPWLLLEMARCEHRLGHSAKAVKLYRYYLSAIENVPPAHRAEAEQALLDLRGPIVLPQPAPEPEWERADARLTQEQAALADKTNAPHTLRGAPLFRRIYIRGSFIASLPGGIYFDLGGERSPIGGLWLSGGIRIANTMLSFYSPTFRGHLTLGYSGRYVAIGLDAGGGAGFSMMGWPGSVDAGLAMRFGSLSHFQVRMLLYWGVYPWVLKGIPGGGELSFLIPVGARSWFDVTAVGDARIGVWGGLTLGGQHYMGSTVKGQSFFTWGIGAALVVSAPGALFQFGYGYRY